MANTYGSPWWVVDPRGGGGLATDSPSGSLHGEESPASLSMLLALAPACFPSADDKQAVCAQRCSFGSRSCMSMEPKLGHGGAILKCLMMSELLYCLLGGLTWDAFLLTRANAGVVRLQPGIPGNAWK